MEESIYSPERREHKRSRVSNGVTAVLITSSPEVIGSVIDLSMGGAKISYHEHKNIDLDFSALKVDLVSDDHFVEAIPCKSAWNCKADDYTLYGSGDLWQCGIEFLDLTPNQTFLLREFINSSAGSEVDIAAPGLPVSNIQ